MNRWPGLARHLSWLQSRSQLTTADSLKTLIATSELPPGLQDINPRQFPGCRSQTSISDWVLRHSTINCAGVRSLRASGHGLADDAFLAQSQERADVARAPKEA